MASGDSLFVLTAISSAPTATSAATFDTLAITGATPDSYIPVLDFDGAADEHADWIGLEMPSNYEGSGITVQAWYAMDGTNGATAIELEVRAITFAEDDALATAKVIDTQTEATITDTPINATANELSVSGTATISHSDIGSPAVGAMMMFRITRDISPATNTDDLQFIKLRVTET